MAGSDSAAPTLLAPCRWGTQLLRSFLTSSQCQIKTVQTLDLSAEPRQIAIIHKHVIGMLQALFALSLSIENGTHLLLAGLISGRRACDLEQLWHIHDQHSTDLTILPGLDKQRRDHDGVRRFGQGEMPGDLGANQRMQELFEPLPLGRVSKYFLTQPSAVQLTALQQDLFTKALNNLLQGRPPRPNYPAGGLVRIDHMHAQAGEPICNRGLSTTDTASQPENPRLHPSTAP